MSAMDPDCGVNAIVNYTLSDSFARPQFSVKPDSGELCVTAPLDHEAMSDFEFPVIATDRGKALVDKYNHILHQAFESHGWTYNKYINSYIYTDVILGPYMKLTFFKEKENGTVPISSADAMAEIILE